MNKTMRYLHFVAASFKKFPSGMKRPETFLLRHGRSFTEKKMALEAERGPLGKCFETAAKLAIWSKEFVYCEGVAVAGDLMPLPHAWLAHRKTAVVLDPTWNDGHGYFGVAICNAALRRIILAEEYYALLWKEYGPGPLQKMEPAELERSLFSWGEKSGVSGQLANNSVQRRPATPAQAGMKTVTRAPHALALK